MNAHTPTQIGRYGTALSTTLRATAAAYGYTLSIATTIGLLTATHGSPNSGRLFLFVAGGVAGFAALELALLVIPSNGEEVQHAIPFAGVANLVSVCAALGAATGLAHAISGTVGWFVTPLGSTIAYLALVAAQVTVVASLRR